MTPSCVIDLPTPRGFVRLRNMARWGDVTPEQARRALSHSVMGICLYDAVAKKEVSKAENKAQEPIRELIGMARLVGDGVFNVYIQDVIVKPCYQRQGLGRIMLKALIVNMTKTLDADCTIGLMAANGQSGFYTQFGFKARPRTGFGAAMSAQLKDLSL